MTPRAALIVLCLASTLAIAGACSTNVALPFDAVASGSPSGTPSGAPSPISTTISGVTHLQQCAPLLGDSALSGITVRNAASVIAQGNEILLWQVQDTTTFAPGDTVFDTTHLQNAGKYEIATVQAVAGNQVTLTADLGSLFTSNGPARAQVCRIDSFDQLSVPAGAILTTTAWDGTSGGVVTARIHGTLALNGAIDVSALGFRGGAPVPDATLGCSVAPDVGGYEGEGVAFLAGTKRNNLSIGNSGAGGDPYASGGGGGGNAAPGGKGGISVLLSSIACASSYGRGGLGAPLSDRLFFGGGGGAGAQKTAGSDPATGGRGGGLLFLLVDAGATLSGNTGELFANGEPGAGGAVLNNVDSQGAAGGGAGGTIHLDIPMQVVAATTAPWNVSARGGNGQATISTFAYTEGGGGGGGGGRLAIPQAPTSFTFDASGGAGGTSTNSGGATSGNGSAGNGAPTP